MRPTIIAVAFALFVTGLTQVRADETFLVRDSQPQAEIVIAEQTPRTTRLAAQELQRYLQKISGAMLEIVHQPTANVSVQVFVGRSEQTDKLKVTADGLKYGAYRIVSGDHWLVLIGDDTDFVPPEPWPRNNSDWVSGRVHDEWHRLTKSTWGNPLSQTYKHYTGSTSLFDTPREQLVDRDGNVNVWGFDERGSFNAVCGYLRSLGVRWYLPGELGEVVPKMASLPLPKIDETVRPDFPVRKLNIKLGTYGRDAAMWAMHLGVRNPFGLQTAHGLDHMTHNKETLKKHPEWFALYGGKRHNQPAQRLNQLCYSNEELLSEAVRFARAQFDIYKYDVVSIMPPDGYTAICQCELCKGKDQPERGNRGALSNYVWEFVNRVAREVRKTHPDKMISNCAYGIYTLPPTNIEKLEPNVQVIIVGGRRPTSEDREYYRQLQEGWKAKTDNPILIFENYPFTGRGFYLPAYIHTVLGETINATKDFSLGEDIWLTMDLKEKAVGFNHFLMYFTARMYWGGPEKDVSAMFDEYCRLFYGPASAEMAAFFKYCEANWRAMEKDEVKADRALELFSVAKGAAGADSVYGKRIQLIDNYLEGLRNKRVQLAQKRKPVPRLRLVGRGRGQIVIDGKLDDELWQECPVASTGRMSELQTGRLPTFGTSFKTAWVGNDLYFAIRCEERKGEKLNIATRRNGDQAMWYGDVVEILLDTDSHSYYQIAVNPAGALIDLDRGAPKSGWFNWDSKAEVATQVADDYWTVEIRIPVTEDENDPLHQVIGHRPTQSLPWHVNLCRQRIREHGAELSAFAPTGTSGFHEPLKFAHFYDGRSYQFDADPSVSDFLIEYRAAERIQRSKPDVALAAYLKLAEREKVTDEQKSAALEQAVQLVLRQRDYEQATKFAAKIPVEAVAKTVQMEILLAQRKWDELVEQFGGEDLTKWPFWKAGDGYFARGRAYASAGMGEKAEADLQGALELTPEKQRQIGIQLEIGRNREKNLKNDAAALKIYLEIANENLNNGGADYFAAVQSAARLQTKAGKFDDVLATLRLVQIDKLKGHWRGSMLLAVGETLTAAGRKDAAIGVYKQVLADETVIARHRKAAEDALNALKESSPQ